jgi:hypothetical protein
MPRGKAQGGGEIRRTDGKSRQRVQGSERAQKSDTGGMRRLPPPAKAVPPPPPKRDTSK